jgi:hypothetical protein
MNTAPVIDNCEFDCPGLIEQAYSMGYEIVEQFVEAIIPKLDQAEKMSIPELSSLFMEHREEFFGQMLQGFIQILHQKSLNQEFAPCPRCGRQHKRLRLASRKIETRTGPSLIERPYFYCPKCKVGYSPIDNDLELLPKKKQADLQELALEFMAEMPFERACELFYKATGIWFSEGGMHKDFEEFGNYLSLEDVIPSKEDIEERIDELAKVSTWKPVLMVATDGAHAPLRPPGKRKEKRGPCEYKEAKGFRIYLVGAKQIVHIASWHQVSNVEEITNALSFAAKRIPQEKVRIGLIGDGASWLWRAMKTAFPQGREILDYYHCSERVHALGEALYPDDPYRALEWIESTMTRLSFKKGVSYVIGGLKRLNPRKPEVQEKVRKAINYFQEHKGRTNYKGSRIGGYHIGSGGIESANKFICHTRLKRSGAWWLKINCNNMLKLRCSIWNRTYEKAFKNYTAEKANLRL